MKKKNILIASYSLDFGGIETSLINLLKNMNQNKYNITLVLEKKEGVFLNDVPNNIIVKEYKVSNNKNLLIRKTINLIKEIKWILFNYKKYDASICYATYSKPCSFLARASSNNKIIFVHNDYYQSFEKDIDMIKSFFTGLKIKNYNHIVFVSNESRTNLCNIIPTIKMKSQTINNLIDSERIIKLSKEKISEKSNNKKIFLFVGRLDEKQKRISKIIETAISLKKIKNIEFWILGTGPDEGEYKKKIEKEKLSNVKFLGAKKNPYPYMKASDYIILTSKYEGFPVVYNEAIILNKPIITTVDVSDDYISIKNRFGIIISNDVKQISKTIKDIVKTDFKIKEKVDFKKLNKKRINDIERLIDE